jgi:hypothetical protein
MTRVPLIVAVLSALALAPQTPAGDLKKKEYQKAIDKGLEWIVKNQHRDGHWEANGSQYPVTMTAMSGLVLLMEGSTLREGKYANEIRRTVEWLMERSQPNGLIGNPNHPGEAGRYTYGHGYALLFLACVYGDEEDERRRKQLEDVLTRAVKFCGDAQTNRGGWGYVSARDGGGFDEGSTTITQLQALRAARNAGIAVPKETIDRANKYLKDATLENGAIIYSLAQGRGQGGPALVAAALAGSFSTGEYDNPLAKKWLTYCRSAIPIAQAGRFGHDEYTHYYYAQVLYILGEEGYDRLFPNAREDDRLTWSKYRDPMCDHLARTQNADGSWSSGNIGTVFTTAVNLTIMQLDKGTLPFYQR